MKATRVSLGCGSWRVFTRWLVVMMQRPTRGMMGTQLRAMHVIAWVRRSSREWRGSIFKIEMGCLKVMLMRCGRLPNVARRQKVADGAIYCTFVTITKFRSASVLREAIECLKIFRLFVPLTDKKAKSDRGGSASACRAQPQFINPNVRRRLSHWNRVCPISHSRSTQRLLNRSYLLQTSGRCLHLIGPSGRFKLSAVIVSSRFGASVPHSHSQWDCRCKSQSTDVRVGGHNR